MTSEQWVPGAAPPDALRDPPLRMDRWRDTDAADLLAAVEASSEHLAPFMPWSIGYDSNSAEWFLGDAERSWHARTAFSYRLSGEDLGAGRVLGGVGLMARHGPGVLEVGYWVRADVVRRGIARRATARLVSAGLALPGVERIEIHHDPLNVASAAIPARLGFTRLPDLVPGPPGREEERHVCWVRRQQYSVPVRG